jgi:hypothetical protein
MSETKDWLARLDQATSYRELQSAVSQMFAAANSTNDSAALAAAIDEAIRRIENERARDQAELKSDTADYDAFKQQQSGVLGWLKRKMPFTETRRQDVQHREAIDEQKAEVLADNFIIARAQMLKERLLPPDDRRMGARLDEWQNRFLKHESIHGIREYGAVVQALTQSVSTASVFVKNVQIDIEAFSQADFADKEDRARRDVDLQVGRSEAKALQDEVQSKSSLRKSAIKRLSELVRDELLSQDPSFRTVVDHSQQLSEVFKQFPGTLKLVDDRLTNSKTLLAKLKELQTIPELLDKQQHATQALRRQCDEAESRLASVNRDLINPAQQYESATRNLEQSKLAYNAAKPMYDAYIAEQQGIVGDSPVVAEHARLQSMFRQAEGDLQRILPEFERVKRIFDKAKSEATSCGQKLDESLRKHAELTEAQTKLENDCRVAKDRLQWGKNDYMSAAQGYSHRLRDLSWLTEFNQLKGVPASNHSSVTIKAIGTGHSDLELQELSSEVDRLEIFAKALRADQELIRTSSVKLAASRIAALKQRSLMLLDPSVVGELVFE